MFLTSASMLSSWIAAGSADTCKRATKQPKLNCHSQIWITKMNTAPLQFARTAVNQIIKYSGITNKGGDDGTIENVLTFSVG